MWHCVVGPGQNATRVTRRYCVERGTALAFGPEPPRQRQQSEVSWPTVLVEGTGWKHPASGARARKRAALTRARNAIQAALRKRSGSNGSSKSVSDAIGQALAARPANHLGRFVGGAPSLELAKYLQDHFAGARAGLELARRLAERARPASWKCETLRPGDRARPRAAEAGDGNSRGRVRSGEAGQCVARRKVRCTSGRSRHAATARRSGCLLELESLSLGVEGKALLWQALIELKDLIPELVRRSSSNGR